MNLVSWPAVLTGPARSSVEHRNERERLAVRREAEVRALLADVEILCEAVVDAGGDPRAVLRAGRLERRQETARAE